MIQLFKAEGYRLFHKKSAYLFYALLSLGFVALTFMISPDYRDASGFARVASTVLEGFAPILIGTQVFIAVYNDDLSGRTMGTQLSLGQSRLTYLMVKFIWSILYTLIVLMALCVVFLLTYSFWVHDFSHTTITTFKPLVQTTLISWMAMVVYIQIGAIFTFWFMKASTGLVFYMVVAVQMVYGMIQITSMVLSPLADMLPYLWSGLIIKQYANSSLLPEFFIGAAAYTIGSLLLCWLALSKKEIRV